MPYLLSFHRSVANASSFCDVKGLSYPPTGKPAAIGCCTCSRKQQSNTDYQVWTHENHAVSLYSTDFTAEKIDYIHNNPVRAYW